MDLYKEWDTLNRTKFNNPILNKQEIMNAINQESQLSIAILKKRLGYKIYFIFVLLTIVVISMLLSLKDTEMLIILSVPLIMYTVFLIPTLINYRRIKTEGSLSENITQAIKNNVSLIRNTLRLEFFANVVIMPVSIVYGMFLGNHLAGGTASTAIHSRTMLLVGFISLIILVPRGIKISLQLNKKAFGRHLRQLQDNITRLEVLN